MVERNRRGGLKRRRMFDGKYYAWWGSPTAKVVANLKRSGWSYRVTRDAWGHKDLWVRRGAAGDYKRR